MSAAVSAASSGDSSPQSVGVRGRGTDPTEGNQPVGCMTCQRRHPARRAQNGSSASNGSSGRTRRVRGPLAETLRIASRLKSLSGGGRSGSGGSTLSGSGRSSSGRSSSSSRRSTSGGYSASSSGGSGGSSPEATRLRRTQRAQRRSRDTTSLRRASRLQPSRSSSRTRIRSTHTRRCSKTARVG